MKVVSKPFVVPALAGNAPFRQKGGITNMHHDLIAELERNLAASTAAQRKHWAKAIIDRQIPMSALFPLLHEEGKTAQRFTWLITDIADLDLEQLRDNMSFLFALRDEFNFSGMHRSVSKWLMMTNVPAELEDEAIPQLCDWLGGTHSCIASKSYSSKALLALVQEGRFPQKRLNALLLKESRHANESYACRIRKLRDQLNA